MKTFTIQYLFYIMLVMIIFFKSFASAQNIVNSLSERSPVSKKDDKISIEILRYLDSAKFFAYKDARKQEYFAGKALGFAARANDTTAMIDSHLNLAESYSARGVRFRDVQELRQALQLIMKKNDPTKISDSYNKLSNAYRLLLRYDSASIFAESAMFYAKQANDSSLYMNAWGNWAQVRVRKSDFKTALPIFERLNIFYSSFDSFLQEKEI